MRNPKTLLSVVRTDGGHHLRLCAHGADGVCKSEKAFVVNPTLFLLFPHPKVDSRGLLCQQHAILSIWPSTFLEWIGLRHATGAVCISAACSFYQPVPAKGQLEISFPIQQRA